MALIKNAKGRKDGSGYARILGDRRLGLLISRVQAAVISAGSEPERIIASEAQQIDDLDEFLHQQPMSEGVWLATKKAVKQSKTLRFAGSEPDFLIFKRRGKRQNCHIVELKDGNSFDTKKAAGERQSIHNFIAENAQHIAYTMTAHFVAVNQESQDAIYEGFKRKISIEECMTGREFCEELLEIDYDAIVRRRKRDASANFRYCLDRVFAYQIYPALN